MSATEEDTAWKQIGKADIFLVLSDLPIKRFRGEKKQSLVMPKSRT